MKKIILMDTHIGGHHLMYLRFISKTLLEFGHQVMVFCPNPDQVANWIAAECPEHLHRLKALPGQEPKPVRLPILGQVPQPFNVLARWHYAATIAQASTAILQGSPDLFLFNWLDSQLSAYVPHLLIDQIFPYPWAGLCFQPRLPFNPSWTKRMGRFNYHQVLSAQHCRGVGVLDEGIAAMLQPQIRSPVIAFPDFTDESTPDSNFDVVQQLRQQAQGRKIVGLFGSLNKRKGLLTLLECALRSESESWFFAFVGQLSTYTMLSEEKARVQAIVSAAPSNCFFHFELIPDEPQFNALVEASDVLFAAYEKFPYSSNILTKAAIFNKSVIASEGFCMGERVKQFHMGVAIAEGSVHECIGALQALCNPPLSAFLEPMPRPNFAGYRHHYSIDRLRVALQEVLSNV
jgi:glycosyltransferase involved in cell wall biosynthesis